MNQKSESPTRTPQVWMVDEDKATTTTTMGHVDRAEPDHTSGGFYEPGSSVEWSSWVSTIGLLSSISSHLKASGSRVTACQLVSPESSHGAVQSFIRAIRAVYAIPKDQYGDAIATLSYCPMWEGFSHHEPGSSRIIRLIIESKRQTDEWPIETERSIKSLLTFLQDCDPSEAGSVQSSLTHSVEQEYIEPESTTWRGVFALSHSRTVLFSQQVEIRTADLPRWKPHITIDRRTLERDDE